MPGQRVCQFAASAALLLTAQWIPLSVSFGATPCQTASDPNGLLASITVAEHRSKMSTDMLKLMLPCPGTPVSAGSLAQGVSAGFTPDQINLLLQAFTVTAVTPSDLVQLARTSLPTPEKERICNLRAPLMVTPVEFKQLDLSGMYDAQVDFVATHLQIRATEKEFAFLLSSPASSHQPVLLQRCLLPLSLTIQQSVLLLVACPYRKVLSGKITISDPVLWGNALRKGASLADVSLFLDADEHGAWDVANAFQRAGLSNSTITDFLVANEKRVSLSASDVEHLSQSSLSDEQVTQIIRTLGHPALQLQPSSVARLKARGINDEVVLALTQEKVLALFPPSITADSYGDPLTKLASLSDRQNTHGLGNGSSNGFGSGSGDTNGANGIFRVGGDISAPVLVSKVEPEYSEEALKAKLAGAVSLSLVIDANGTPRDIHVIRQLGHGLDEKAVEAVMKWRFRPGMKGGHPVATQATAEITFRLNESGPTREANSIADAKKTERQNKPPKPVVSNDLRVEIVQVQWNTSEWGASGFGKGNLLGNQNKQGFDFTFS